jgi:hypothetical protein
VVALREWIARLSLIGWNNRPTDVTQVRDDFVSKDARDACVVWQVVIESAGCRPPARDIPFDPQKFFHDRPVTPGRIGGLRVAHLAEGKPD